MIVCGIADRAVSGHQNFVLRSEFTGTVQSGNTDRRNPTGPSHDDFTQFEEATLWPVCQSVGHGTCCHITGRAVLNECPSSVSAFLVHIRDDQIIEASISNVSARLHDRRRIVMSGDPAKYRYLCRVSYWKWYTPEQSSPRHRQSQFRLNFMTKYRVSHIRCSTALHERDCVACPRREQGKATLRRLAALKTR
jgi:hypothetical protein